jgi:hypothetical protein
VPIPHIVYLLVAFAGGSIIVLGGSASVEFPVDYFSGIKVVASV